MFGRFGWAEILVIVVLLLILFGHAKIPSMMKNLADGLNIFKREMKSDNKKQAAATTAESKPVKKQAVKKGTTKKRGANKKSAPKPRIVPASAQRAKK